MFDVEILYLAERLRYRIAQIPVRWRDDGDSRLNLMAGNLENVLDIFRIRFARPAGDAQRRIGAFRSHRSLDDCSALCEPSMRPGSPSQ